jgi:hypothetical protein
VGARREPLRGRHASKPTDGPSCGRFIGFLPRAARRRQGVLGHKPRYPNLPAPAWGWRGYRACPWAGRRGQICLGHICQGGGDCSSCGKAILWVSFHLFGLSPQNGPRSAPTGIAVCQNFKIEVAVWPQECNFAFFKLRRINIEPKSLELT